MTAGSCIRKDSKRRSTPHGSLGAALRLARGKQQTFSQTGILRSFRARLIRILKNKSVKRGKKGETQPVFLHEVLGILAIDMAECLGIGRDNPGRVGVKRARSGAADVGCELSKAKDEMTNVPR